MATKAQLRARAAFKRRFAHGFGYGAGRTKSGRIRQPYSSIKVGTRHRHGGYYGHKKEHSRNARRRR